MNLSKRSRLLGLAVVPVLAVGLFFAMQSDLDKSKTENPPPPDTTVSGDQGSGALSIIPSDRDTTKIEYRNILFSRGNRGKALDSADAPSAAHFEL